MQQGTDECFPGTSGRSRFSLPRILVEDLGWSRNGDIAKYRGIQLSGTRKRFRGSFVRFSARGGVGPIGRLRTRSRGSTDPQQHLLIFYWGLGRPGIDEVVKSSAEVPVLPDTQGPLRYFLLIL